jgi:hypothetical protein
MKRPLADMKRSFAAYNAPYKEQYTAALPRKRSLT